MSGSMKRFLFFLSISAFLFHTEAGAYEFIHLTKDNSGLSYDGISTITQDSRGFIWIGTYKGLNRYDGNTFTVYGKEDLGLDSDFIYSIVEDIDGNLWIGTDNGVSMYNYRKDRFEPLTIPGSEGSCIENKVTFILADEEGVIWMLVNEQGCFAYDTRTASLEEWPYSEIGYSGFRKMLKCSDGTFWISRYHSNLYHADKDFSDVRPVDLGPDSGYFSGDEIEGLFHSPDGKLLVASMRKGLTEVDTRMKTVKVLLGFPEGTLLQSAWYEDGVAVWLSTSAGVYRYDIVTGETECLRNSRKGIFSISNDYTCCTFVDRDGGLWIGTKDAGVNYSGPSQNNFEKQYLADGEPMTNVLVSGFAEDDSGRIWVGTEEKGLLVYDPVTHVTSRYVKEGIPSRICSICHDDGLLWFGSRSGLYCLDIASGRLREYGTLERSQGVTDPNVYLIFKTRSGDIIVGTTLCIFKYDRKTDTFRDIPVFDGVFATCAAEEPGRPGVIWFSTFADGVYCWDSTAEDKLICYNSSSGCGLTNDKISSIFIDSKSRVWAVGFSIGLSCFDRESRNFINYGCDNVPVFTSDVFFKAQEDDNGRLWLASDSGLVEFDPDSGGGYVYTLIDGLLDLKFTNSAFRSSTGDMYFGSDNGFVRFSPSELPAEAAIKRVVLSSMQIGDSEAVFDENIDLMSEIVLDHDSNSFGFHFSLLGLSASPSNRVQCRLKGHGDGWRDIVVSKPVFFYNVSPGQYLLEVRTLAGDDMWTQARPPLKIIVRPGFWASAVGSALAVFLFILAISVITWLIQRRYRMKKEQEKEAYIRAKDEEMLREKMNFFSHVIHEIKTPLTLIRTPLGNILSKPVDADTRHDLEVMQNSTVYLSKLVNELLDYVRIERMGYVLKCEEIDVVDRLNSLIFSFTDTARNRNLKLDMKTELEHAFISADSAALDKMLNNLLLNAVKYADTFITVRLSSRDGQVEIRFINDGPLIPEEFRDEIFKPFVQYQDASRNVHGGVGIGLPLARNLAKMHSGDLVLADGGNLTEFVLTLPLSQDGQEDGEHQEEERKADTGRPCVLIADDNREFREYIASKLDDRYDTVIASSADTAFRIMKDENVDILLTDISMPGRTGLDLCRQVREDIEISHIPVIIISARSSVESKIQAMQAGADLYIEKPFDLQYLLSGMENILDRRALMKNALGNGITRTDIDMFGLPKKDEEFLEKFNSLIRENISNTELSNDFLAERLNMSQSTLVRKIRKLMGTSPYNYIRTMRISIAAEMLRDSHGNNITEICYSVGFSNVSYFTKCFKEQYGMTPTEMVRGK